MALVGQLSGLRGSCWWLGRCSEVVSGQVTWQVGAYAPEIEMAGPSPPSHVNLTPLLTSPPHISPLVFSLFTDARDTAVACRCAYRCRCGFLRRHCHVFVMWCSGFLHDVAVTCCLVVVSKRERGACGVLT